MNQPATMITIQQARLSQSGSSLGILGHDQRWYITKEWELKNMVGQTIYAPISEQDWQGKPQYWINDYTVQEPPPGHSIPAQPAPGYPPPAAPVNYPRPAPAIQAPSVQSATPVPRAVGAAGPEAPMVNREASIAAQALCKSVSFYSVDAAFAAYVGLYELINEWQATGRTPQGEANQVELSNQQPADDIPF